jgi:hypothetical protein
MKWTRFQCLALVPLAAAAEAAPPEWVPVAPLPAVEWRGWTNACRLQNERMEVVVVPDIGRIAFLAYGGSSTNLFRLDPALAGRTVDTDAPDYWFNFGGDWLWPAAQARWPEFQGTDWPPSRLIDGRPWSARAWRTVEGDQCCSISQEYGAPLNLRVTRLIRLPKDQAVVSIRQKMERTAESTVPVTLWNISQMAQASRLVMPVDAGSAFPDGYRVLNFAPPEAEYIQACPGALLYRADLGGEHKLGSDSARGWIAMSRGELLIVERAEPVRAPGETGAGATYPDGGCRVELYSNTGLGYAEIETLSEERVLLPGEVLENVLTISAFRLQAPLDGCELVEKIQTLIGERPGKTGGLE